MLMADAKAQILAEWRALPQPERQTENQAAVFAMRAAHLYEFRSSGDRYQVIMGWIKRYMNEARKLEKARSE